MCDSSLNESQVAANSIMSSGSSMASPEAMAVSQSEYMTHPASMPQDQGPMNIEITEGQPGPPSFQSPTNSEQEEPVTMTTGESSPTEKAKPKSAEKKPKGNI